MSATTAAPKPRKAKAADDLENERSVISPMDLRQGRVRAGVTIIGVIVLAILVIACAGPLLWLFKAATSTSTETLANPFALWPSGLHWENFAQAFSRFQFGSYLFNTLIVCVGSWFFGMLVATTGGYAISVLRPRYAKVVEALVLATLFIPGVISLIALYLTVMKMPLTGTNLLNTYWAVWLPASASAFNVMLVSRFLRGIPADLYDAAGLDGAGPFRIFWTIVLPLAKPILGVLSLLTLIAAYKDFLWPMLALSRPDLQPISVALPRMSKSIEMSVLMAAMFISVSIPVALFLLFQKQFLRAAGSAGAIKE